MVSDEQSSMVTPENIPLSEPSIRGNEWKYVKECLDTGWVSSAGPFVGQFESDLAAYIGVRHAVATASGTAALHVALLVAGVGPGDEVLVPTLTFIATVNALRYVGANPIFIDAEPSYLQMDTRIAREFLENQCVWNGSELRNRRTNGRVRALMPVHVLGHPVDMDPLLELAAKYKLHVIEDASESLGARYKNRMTGSIGDIACFSFNGNKILTTGGGGMIVTNNEVWAARARHLTTQAKRHPTEYVHDEVGYNYRLTNLQAAVGCAQMERLDDMIGSRRANAAAYAAQFASVPGLTSVGEAPWAFSNFWLYTVLVDVDRYGMDSRALLKSLSNAGIQARPIWQPIHLSMPYKNAFPTHCPQAELLYQTALNLPSSFGLTRAQLERVVREIADAVPGSLQTSKSSG